MEEKNQNTYSSLFSLFASISCLINAAITELDHKIDKIGAHILYFRLGLVIVLWIFCALILKLFFAKKLWKSNYKMTLIMLICVILLSVIRVSYFTDAFSDFLNGTKTITTNEYSVVWDKIYFTSNSNEYAYAYVSEDIAKTLNDNKVLTVTSNFDIEREDYVEIVYYPKTHILISAEIIKHTDR